MWLNCRDLFEKGGLTIEEFDNMTMKRILRIINMQQKRLEDRQQALEEQRKKQEAENRTKMKYKRK